MSEPIEIPEAKERQRLSLSEATNQAARHFGFTPMVEIEEGGEVFVVRAKLLRTSAQVRRFNDLERLVKSLDYEEIDRTNRKTGELVVHPESGAVVVDKRTVTPHQLDGKPLDPPYEFRYLAALWGEERARLFEKLCPEDGSAGAVMLIEQQIDDEIAQWRKARERSERALEGGEPKSN